MAPEFVQINPTRIAPITRAPIFSITFDLLAGPVALILVLVEGDSLDPGQVSGRPNVNAGQIWLGAFDAMRNGANQDPAAVVALHL